MATRVRKQKPTPRMLPIDGSIRGGPLNRWKFLFLRFVASPRALVLRATCTPPAWPFPKDINLDQTLLGELVGSAPTKNVAKEERQKFVPLETEIEAAFKLAQLPVPMALIWQQTIPLRDIVGQINQHLAGATR